MSNATLLVELFTEELAKKIAECSAVVCYNDEIAFRLIPLLLSHGVRVPQDVAIVSFDNSVYAQLSPIPFRSLQSPKEQLGRLAAEKMIHILALQPETSSVLPWTLPEAD